MFWSRFKLTCFNRASERSILYWWQRPSAAFHTDTVWPFVPFPGCRCLCYRDRTSIPVLIWRCVCVERGCTRNSLSSISAGSNYIYIWITWYINSLRDRLSSLHIFVIDSLRSDSQIWTDQTKFSFVSASQKHFYGLKVTSECEIDLLESWMDVRRHLSLSLHVKNQKCKCNDSMRHRTFCWKLGIQCRLKLPPSCIRIDSALAVPTVWSKSNRS